MIIFDFCLLSFLFLLFHSDPEYVVVLVLDKIKYLIFKILLILNNKNEKQDDKYSRLGKNNEDLRPNEITRSIIFLSNILISRPVLTQFNPFFGRLTVVFSSNVAVFFHNFIIFMSFRFYLVLRIPFLEFQNDSLEK